MSKLTGQYICAVAYSAALLAQIYTAIADYRLYHVYHTLTYTVFIVVSSIHIVLIIGISCVVAYYIKSIRLLYSAYRKKGSNVANTDLV